MYAYAKTLHGDELEVNGDAFVTVELSDFMILMVADGEGGQKGLPNIGAIGAGIVLDFLEKAIQSNPNITITEIDTVLDNAFFAASRTYRTLNGFDPRYTDIYASLACLVVSTVSFEMVIRTIGNCEIQSWKNKRFNRMNDLHTEAYEELMQGKIQEYEYYVQPNRSILTSGLGHIDDIKTYSIRGKCHEGDIYFMATDGIFQFMTPDVIINDMSKANTPNEGVDLVIADLEKNQHRDDATLLCLFVE